MNRNAWLRSRTGAVAALFLLCGAGAAVSQGPPDPEAMVERQMTNMKERLKLTPDQQKKVKVILTDQVKAMMAMREKYKFEPGQPPSEEAMAAMKKNREETNKKLAEVLTKEQLQTYRKMMAERRGPGGPGGPGGRSGPGGPPPPQE